MENYANSIAYKEYLEQYEYIFEEMYFMGQEVHALTGEFKLTIDNYNHSYDITPNYGKSISCQHIKLFDDAGNQLFTARYAFGKLFYQYIRHSNNNEYFLSGIDLMEFSIYNITKNEEYRFVSSCRVDDDSEEDCDNEFWYIREWICNPTTNLVAINGQDQMNCATVTICDFTNPEVLPLKFKNLYNPLADSYDDGTCHAIRWTDDHCLVLDVREENPKVIKLTAQKVWELLNVK